VPDVRSGDDDQQGRNPDGRENVKHFGPLFIDQNENDGRQAQNPKVGEPSSSLCFVRLHSLTHDLFSLGSGWKQGKGWRQSPAPYNRGLTPLSK
jgi:hypothetical protein